MKKQCLSLAAAVLGLGVFAGGVFAEELSWEEVGIGNTNVTTVLVEPKDPQKIILGAEKGIFFSRDRGKHWKRALFLSGENRGIRVLAYGQDNEFSIYAATGNGLFFSPDQAKTWKRIFRGKSALEKDCLAFAVSGDLLYLGTGSGLFVSDDQGKNWSKQPGILGHSKIISVAASKNGQSSVYVSCVEGLFRKQNNLQSWDKVFNAFSGELELDQQDPFDLEEELISAIRSVAIDPRDPGRVYLATNSGIMQSLDSGRSWLRLTDQGLLEKQIKAVAVGSDSQLYCATKSGVFFWKDNFWQNLSFRPVSGEIYNILADSRGDLFVASSKGLFKSKKQILPEEAGKQDNLKSGSSTEGPGIAALQQAAIRYAEVEPEKISSWRRLAGKKAWLPRISLGLNRQTTDLWHWESGSTTKDCDDALRKGHDSFDWGVSLSWELSDIVWSEAQTSIDVRSRLNVQLRNDILDEVTKIYFERMRVKAELEDTEILEKKKRREKQLRLNELDAYLDGLTGGYFCRNIRD